MTRTDAREAEGVMRRQKELEDICHGQMTGRQRSWKSWQTTALAGCLGKTVEAESMY